jgi:hypothetical protein
VRGPFLELGDVDQPERNRVVQAAQRPLRSASDTRSSNSSSGRVMAISIYRRHVRAQTPHEFPAQRGQLIQKVWIWPIT